MKTNITRKKISNKWQYWYKDKWIPIKDLVALKECKINKRLLMTRIRDAIKLNHKTNLEKILTTPVKEEFRHRDYQPITKERIKLTKEEKMLINWKAGSLHKEMRIC